MRISDWSSDVCSSDLAKREYAALKAAVEAAGRDPEKFRICNVLYTVVAPTRAEAEGTSAIIQSLPLEIDSLSLLSEALNFDFATKGMDDTFTDEEVASISVIHKIRDRVPAYTAQNTTNPR